jgi:photosystem II stability/assembly factor-like uncharacterized protein
MQTTSEQNGTGQSEQNDAHPLFARTYATGWLRAYAEPANGFQRVVSGRLRVVTCGVGAGVLAEGGRLALSCRFHPARTISEQPSVWRLNMVAHRRFWVTGALLFVALAGSLAGQSVPVAEQFERLHFRSIGPATMSGRISDLAVYERNPAVYYVATAHGGVWKTTSNGALFSPLFQNEGLISTGAIAISQSNPDLVWVGAGESNNRQSTSWGGGIYKSTDGGKTFQPVGLPESRHINRIVIDPSNNDIVLVAATGPLFGSGGDRGVYKTTDGGRNWRRVLQVDDETGANDLVQSATEPRTWYASTYQRRRNACCMNGGGPGSGIWKSVDGGDTWVRITGGGLPAGPLGRIALDAYRQNGNIVYATIEGPGGGRGGGGEEAGPGADTAAAGRGGRAGGGGGGQGAGVSGVYRSDDGGSTWRRLSNVNPRPMYFSQIRVDPNSAERIYMGGVGLHMSIDGGRSFATDAALVTHDDVHAIWINPGNSEHVLIGNDGGLAVSYDMSKTWTYLPNLPVGLFYHVSYDMERPFNVCGGMQDNYNWCGPSASRMNRGIMNYDWFQIQGGDGFHAIPDLRDARIIYTESQNGNMIRRNKVTGESKNIRPTPANVTNATAGESYRFNWDSPMMLSPHDPGVLLVAANRVFRSTDRGDSWRAISPDLTSNADRNTIVTMGVRNDSINISRNDGISAWPTIISLAESPRQAGVFYTGTDDGVVSVSRDSGRTWHNVTSKLPNLPAGGAVSEVVPSRHAAGTVYVTVDNHLLNDYNSYIWASTDFGATFRSISANLRGENVRTLTEDLKNPDVLYIGTESGLFLSLDRGGSWRRLKANLPTVRIDEIALHPRDNAMIVATHGRVLWILDHLEPIQEYAAAQRVANARLFTVPGALQWKQKDDRNDEFWGHQFFVGENPPVDAVIQYHLKQQVNDLKLRITSAAGASLREITAPGDRRTPGIQTLCWDQRVEPIATPQDSAAAAGGGRAGAPGRGGGGGRGGANIPGVPTPLPTAGYLPVNPCALEDESGGQGRGGGGGGRGGGGGNAGPHVVPGTYSVALVVDGAVVESKPLRIIMDPAVPLTVAQRTRYNEVVSDLHELQRRGVAVAARLTALSNQLSATDTNVKSSTDVPAELKTQFDALTRDFNTVRVKFGVAAPGASGRGGAAGGGRGGGGGGGGRGGGAPDPADVLGRTAALKGQLMSIWEVPSAALVAQYNELKLTLPRAVTEANAFLARARTMSESLRRHSITLNVPPAQ